MKTVLLIDDDNVFLLSIGVRLKSMGYTVCTAKDAASAISVVRKTSPDVIVLDVSLPGGGRFPGGWASSEPHFIGGDADHIRDGERKTRAA